MSDYNYNNEFQTITGTIDGTDFDPHFSSIEAAIASKANIAGPETHTGTHTFDNLTVTGTATLSINGGTWT